MSEGAGAAVSTPPTADRIEPTFLIIGAQKCGTTWLARVLDQHPDVFIAAKKEIHYYDDQGLSQLGLGWYLKHFADAGGARAIGEATPNYLWNAPSGTERRDHWLNDRIPERIHDDFPDLKLLVCLRNPVDRAVSAFFQNIRSRYVSPASRILDVADTHGIVSCGYYARSLRAWFDTWPRDRFQVIIYEEEIRGDAKRETVDRVCDFLDLPRLPTGAELEGVYNPRSGGLYLHLHHRLPRLARWAVRMVPPLKRVDWPRIEVTAAEREVLAGRFAEEIVDLEAILGRDLSVWRTG